MEEDKKGSEQPEKNVAQKGAETAKKAVNGTKKAVRTIKKIIDFVKAHPYLAKILLVVILIIVVIILLVCIIYTIDKALLNDTSSTMDEITNNIQSMYVSSTDEGEEKDVSYIESGASIDGNKYVLKYGNYSEEEKKQKVQEMKDILAKRNIEIYSNQCLLFLYELKENGLDLGLYGKGDLEALYMFYKAQIATTSIDLRPADEIYDKDGNYNKDYLKDTIVPQYNKNEDDSEEEATENEDSEENEKIYGYNKGDYDENDYSDDTVYGTVRIQRMTYNAETVGEAEGKISYLTYKPYTQFKSLLDEKKEEVLDYFTIDSDYNLIVAGWSKVNTTYTISGLENYSSEEQSTIKSNYPQGEMVKIDENGQKVPAYQAKEPEEYNVYKCRSIPYQEFISKYSLNCNFLMSLLTTTWNSQFCKEVAKLAEKSYIVITLHEEYSKTDTTTITRYQNFEKIYSTLDVNYSAKSIIEEKVTNPIDFSGMHTDKDGMERINKIAEDYGYLDDPNHRTVRVGQTGKMRMEWTANQKKYVLTYKGATIESFKVTVSENVEKPYSDTKNNIFITKDRNLIKDGFPTQSIKQLPAISEEETGLQNTHLEALDDYTKMTEKKYTVTNVTISENNSYKLEITEINNWYEYYKKNYSSIKEPEVKPNDVPEYTENLEITKDNIGKRSITDSTEINSLDYINEFYQQTNIKDDFVKKEIGKQDLTDIKVEINKVEENYYKYGYAYTKSNSSITTYKKGKDSTENVDIKVQPGNKEGYLTIFADEITSNKKNEKNESEKNDSDDSKKEIIYKTTDEMNDGFLSIYDKYESVQKTFNSIDEWAFEMLDSSGTSINITNLLKYLLFLYDGTDLGVTDYNLNLFRPGDLKKNHSMMLLIQYIHMWENSSGPPTNADGTCYIIESDGAGHPTVGYGVDIENSGYKQKFIDAGYPTEIGGEVPIDFVDGIEQEILNTMISDVKGYVSDFDLTEYQLNALISRAYNCGAKGAIHYTYGGMSFYDAYKAYWKEEDDKYEEKDNNADFEHELYKNSMSKPVTSDGMYLQGLENRRRSEWTLFQTGYYDVLDEWHAAGGVIIQWAQYIHEYMAENDYTYCGSNKYDECAKKGKSHPVLTSSFEKSQQEGIKATCCATHVSWVLMEAGYMEESEYTSWAPDIDEFLRNKGWTEITEPSELEPGDVIYYGGHVEFYAGDGTVYSAGCGEAIRGEITENKDYTPPYKKDVSGMIRAWRAPF